MRLVVSLSACALALAACSGVKDTLGLSKPAPDEYQVTSRPPLTVPPDFALRPPRPGAPPTNEASAVEAARAAVIGDEGRSAAASAGEAALLGKAGAAKADPAVRDKLGAEEPKLKKTQLPLEKMMGKKPERVVEPVVDPKAEAERVKAAQEKGEAVTGDDAKTVDPKQSTIDKILN